jgi:hypothetical protein
MCADGTAISPFYGFKSHITINSKYKGVPIRLHNLQNTKAQDIWFLLM